MKTLQQAITAVTLAAVLICMASNIKVKADVIEASEVIAANVPGADLTSIAYAYTNLNDEQRLIADYLLGAYNYTYLCARGFSFNIDQNETNMKATLGAAGERIFQYLTTEYAWRSRFNEVFRQYASSIIVYASKQTVSFDTWISDILSGNRNVYIEYSENAFDAWTEFYNDPSGDGIAHFGDSYSSWYSGDFVDFAFTGLPWNGSLNQNRYNDFVLNYSPIIFSRTYGNQYVNVQEVVSLKDRPVIDSLFLNRNDMTVARFGYSNFSTTFPDSYSYVSGQLQVENGVNYLNFYNTNQVRIRGIINIQNASSYDDVIQYCFNLTPFYIPGYNVYFWYPYIEHVYLVDSLTTLSNPEEIFDTNSLNITAPDMPQYIITPNGKMLIPGYAPINDPFADLWDVSVDINGDTVTEDDFNTQIVNNTVINNYVIDASDKINVPVDWFDNELSDQLANDSIPFLSFARDCIDSLGDLQIYFYGAIVFGLGGGVLKKLLL